MKMDEILKEILEDCWWLLSRCPIDAGDNFSDARKPKAIPNVAKNYCEKWDITDEQIDEENSHLRINFKQRREQSIKNHVKRRIQNHILSAEAE
jgi:hypothetical protein